jgi:DNA-directed RNA polymerase specialized sigma24 family protein
MQTCYHKCLAVQRRGERHVEFEADELPEPSVIPNDLLAELEQDQAVRNAVHALPERCRRLVQMLFYEDPPRSYDSVAQELDIAIGSVGFIRGRCLQKMRKQLEGIRDK